MNVGGKVNLREITDDELRAEARRRGYELHSLQFSQAAQNALRELEGLRRRIDELVKGLQQEALQTVRQAEIGLSGREHPKRGG
jgi:hypothetical protein